MAHFRKIDPRIWNDEKFMSMTAQGQLACFFLLTHPHMQPVGALRATIAGVASEHPALHEKGFREPCEKGIAKIDKKAPLIWFPNFLKYNPPDNPNVVKAWVKSLDYLPECSTKNQIILHVKGFLKGFAKGFQEPWPDGLPKSMAKQEQEQEQEEEKKKSPPSQKPKKKKFIPPTQDEVVQYFIDNGYSATAAKKAFQYYDTAEWKDAYGKQVKNWKQKMISVWFKPENKMTEDQKPKSKEYIEGIPGGVSNACGS